MSETEAATKRAMPAVPVIETVTDSLGRVLTFKRQDALAELDLIEVAGQLAENRAWMLRATLAACVVEIDGLPVIPPSDMKNLRTRIRTVGSEGIAAVVSKLSEAEQEVASAAVPDPADVAKN